MRILYVGTEDVLYRHELGFMASLKSLGRVNLVIIDSGSKVKEKLKIVSDNGFSEVAVLKINISVMKYLYRYTIIEKMGKILKPFKKYFEDYDVIFTTPREPLILSIVLHRSLNLHLPVILRLWSIRAAKLKDNIRFKAYNDIAIFLPSILANLIYLSLSDASITVDYATYMFAKSMYSFYSGRLYKIYPPYGYVLPDDESLGVYDEEAYRLLDSLDDYILSFTVLSKHGSYLKFEAKPHALILYKLARKLRNTNIILAGSSYEDWKRVFQEITPPPNLRFIKGFSDKVLGKLYKKAKLVIVPITNRNISNRLLEAFYFSKPIITSEVVKFIHPELRHRKHVYISHWDTIVEEASKIASDDQLLSELEAGAKEAYIKYFSTKVNRSHMLKLLKALEIL